MKRPKPALIISVKFDEASKNDFMALLDFLGADKNIKVNKTEAIKYLLRFWLENKRKAC